MKLLFSEYPAQYDTYTFPYHIWAVQEGTKERDELLMQGFLPTRLKIGLWYLGRSSRVNLYTFTESSENRRIAKQTATYSYDIVPINRFTKDPHIISIIQKYTEDIIGVSFSPASLRRIFSPYLSDVVFVWKENKQIIGISPLMVADDAVFYWYGFYLPEYHKSGLGMRMMLEAIQWAKMQAKQHVYLGTVYSQGSLYKTNFAGFQFFNGLQWRDDVKQLKYLIKRDEQKPHIDLLKDDIWREQFYNTPSLSKLLQRL